MDAVLLLTDHSDFNCEMIKAHAPLLIDTGGKFRKSGETIWRG